MNKKLKGKIISALRRMTWSWQPRNAAKSRQKRDAATFECEECEVFVYEGSKALDDTGLKDKYPSRSIVAGKTKVDHIDPVIPIEGFPNTEWSWDIYVARMFPEDSLSFQVLCEECHSCKTYLETELRKEYRLENKQLSKK